MYEIKHTEKDGRGLYATQVITDNANIMLCELLVLSPEDTIKVNTTELRYYSGLFGSRTGGDIQPRP